MLLYPSQPAVGGGMTIAINETNQPRMKMHNKGNDTLTESPEIMTRKEATAFTRYSDRGFRNALRDGLFPEIKLGKRKRLYRKSALIKALESREVFAG